jgi:hypothetical protein
MRIPPQVPAVRRDHVSWQTRGAAYRGAVPAKKPTGESITCFGSSKTVCTCPQSGGKTGVACCPSNSCGLDGNGLCVCM